MWSVTEWMIPFSVESLNVSGITTTQFPLKLQQCIDILPTLKIHPISYFFIVNRFDIKCASMCNELISKDSLHHSASLQRIFRYWNGKEQEDVYRCIVFLCKTSEHSLQRLTFSECKNLRNEERTLSTLSCVGMPLTTERWWRF